MAYPYENYFEQFFSRGGTPQESPEEYLLNPTPFDLYTPAQDPSKYQVGQGVTQNPYAVPTAWLEFMRRQAENDWPETGRETAPKDIHDIAKEKGYYETAQPNTWPTMRDGKLVFSLTPPPVRYPYDEGGDPGI